MAAVDMGPDRPRLLKTVTSGWMEHTHERQEAPRMQGFSMAGATGLEPATSGVTGVSKRLRLTSSSHLNRMTVRV